jgi:putative transcriptional regulator
MEDSLKGQLLLAAPTLRDPNFARSVVLIGAHSDEGAMGVVLNRPSRVTVSEAVPQLEEAVGGDQPVYVGGPVQPSSIVVLAEFHDREDAGLLVLDSIGFPSADVELEALAGSTARGRVFAGYAGWSANQLDTELEGGDWIPHEAAPADIFSDVAAELWSEVLTRMGGSYALIARMPLDPSLN